MYGIWAYLSTFSKVWAFIWKVGSGSGSASGWKFGSESKSSAHFLKEEPFLLYAWLRILSILNVLVGRKISTIFSVLNILNIPSIRRWYAWERRGPGRRSSWARVSSPHNLLRSPLHLATKFENFSARICKPFQEPKESIHSLAESIPGLLKRLQTQFTSRFIDMNIQNKIPVH